MEHVETNCWNCDKEHFYRVSNSNYPNKKHYSYDNTKFCCGQCSEEYEPTLNRQWIWGNNGTYPPPEHLSDAPDDNEGYDVCNDVDEDFE